MPGSSHRTNIDSFMFCYQATPKPQQCTCGKTKPFQLHSALTSSTTSFQRHGQLRTIFNISPLNLTRVHNSTGQADSWELTQAQSGEETEANARQALVHSWAFSYLGMASQCSSRTNPSTLIAMLPQQERSSMFSTARQTSRWTCSLLRASVPGTR